MTIIEYYKSLLGYDNIPEFLKEYLNVPSLNRIKGVSYFCGMDYASKEIYDFGEYITRFDHSLTVALLTYKLSKDEKATLAALFHDIASPCFSHVIDYMNKDYSTQESTEEYTENIIKKDKKLLRLLKKNNIGIEDIIDFKKYPLVDNKRPRLCADRLDGIILTASLWTKDLDKETIKEILDSIEIYENEDYVDEIGFNNKEIADKVMIINENIDLICHSKEDNYMMELLANITKEAIDLDIIKYEDLYTMKEKELFDIIKLNANSSLKSKINKFENIKIEEVEELDLPYIKRRNILPLVNGVRMEEFSE